MRMREPIPQYTYFITHLKAAHPDLVYLHVIEPEPAHSAWRKGEEPESNDFIRKHWAPKPLITAGGYTRDSALKRTELIAFAKLYISNVSTPSSLAFFKIIVDNFFEQPCLPTRLAKDIPLNTYNASTVYPASGENESAEGYLDYPYSIAELGKQIGGRTENAV